MLIFPNKVSGYRSEIINEIIDILPRLQLLPSMDHEVDVTPGGTLIRNSQISAAGSDPVISFDCQLKIDVVSVLAGSVRLSTANYSVAAADVTLSGVTEWVYVYHERDHSASGISHSATEPVSSGTRWCWPLAYYTATAGKYKLDHICHRGDIFLYLAMA